MTISVIVPIYKVEAYLRQCVDSILAQTYTDLDIVLVDDGSPDNCPAICDAYARQDARVQVVHKPNGGLMSARQAGLRVAKGNYVGFVDGDDWIEPDMYARFAAAIDRYTPDMALCEFYYAFADHNEPSTQHLQRAYYTKAQLAQEIYPTMLYHAPYYSFGINPCCWSKVFKKSLLEQCLYSVTPKVKIGEDAAFTYPCLLAAESLAYVDGCLYHYRNNAQSMTNAYDPTFCDTVWIPLEILSKEFSDLNLLDQFAVYVLYLVQMLMHNEGNCPGNFSISRMRQLCKTICNRVAHECWLAALPKVVCPAHIHMLAFCLLHNRSGLLLLYSFLLYTKGRKELR